MAEPSDESHVERAVSSVVLPGRSNVNSISGNITYDGIFYLGQLSTAACTAANDFDDNHCRILDASHESNDELDFDRGARASKGTITQGLSETSITSSKASMGASTSLFANLPGELRNRIYHEYFGLFVEEKRKHAVFRTTAARYLRLLHVDHMIRTEAGDIFDTEYLCVDSFDTVGVFQDALLCRIRSICALVAIRNASSQISITCTTLSALMDAFQPHEFFRVFDRRKFIDILWYLISPATVGMRAVHFNSSSYPEHGGPHKFFIENRDYGAEMSSGQEYLIQYVEDRDPIDRVVHSAFCISGPLAEVCWPETHWRAIPYPW